MPVKLIVEGQRLSLVEDENVPPFVTRHLEEDDIARLTGFATAYAALLEKDDDRFQADLIDLGRALYECLDGESRGLTRAIEQCSPPMVLEVTCLSRTPSEAENAVLNAPWELLADSGGFLAGNALLGFTPVRRLRPSQTPPDPDQYRLGVVFMAASPRGVSLLDYEAEEAAILRAVGERHIDLVVEESGELEELGHRLAGLAPMTVLHLSCHGTNEPAPMLALEDEQGEFKPATIPDLALKLRGKEPRLIFLSACLTAAQNEAAKAGIAQSLADAMVRAGLPAVLGWSGSVGDLAATMFAQGLYQALADRKSLEDALFDARFKLLQTHDLKRNDWHLARLWLGSRGGGKLVGGARERSLLPATHGHKAFLDAKKSVPVASHEMFVGRRRELKEGLRVLAGTDKAGLLVLGMGRLGKSSLAARLANRRPDLALAVVHGAFDGAAAILDALGLALGGSNAAQAIIAHYRSRVAGNPGVLKEALRSLVCADNAPCCQDSPVLLVIDDLEQILDPPADDNSPHRVKPGYVDVARAVLTAFDPRLTNSRVLFTSRFAFALDGLEAKLHTVQLAAFRDEERRKLLLHQRSAAQMLREKAKHGETEEQAKAREVLAGKTLGLSKGNPGLQDLLIAKFVLAAGVPVSRVETVLAELEAFAEGGEFPKDDQARRFLEGLSLDDTLALAGNAGRELLRAATIFGLPVPEPVMAVLAGTTGGSLANVRGLGLLEPYEDVFDPEVTALAVNALAATRLTPLGEDEARTAVSPVLESLFATWGGEKREQAPVHTDIELLRLALLAENARIAAACGGYAINGLAPRIGYPAASKMGLAALDLCDQQGVKPSVWLLRRTGQACFTAGEVDTAKGLLLRLEEQLEEARRAGEDEDVYTAIALNSDFGDILRQQGELEEAESRFRCIYALAGKHVLDKEAAVAQGKIADILVARGRFDEALETLQQQVFPAFQKIGDIFYMTVAQGKIADILVRRGRLDEAMAIREQQLPIYRKLGDVSSEAVVQGRIADILVARGRLDEAMAIRKQELSVSRKLGDMRSEAVTQCKIADILFARRRFDGAMTILEQQLPVFRKLDDVRELAVTQSKMADIVVELGRLDEAMAIYEQQLPVFRKLGDVRTETANQSKIAVILVRLGRLDEAMALHKQQLDTYRSLGDREGIAATLWAVAQIEMAQGDWAAAGPKIAEAYALVAEMGRLDGIVAIGFTFGQLLAMAGKAQEGLAVLQRSLDGFRQLGMEQDARETEALMARIREYLDNRPQEA